MNSSWHALPFSFFPPQALRAEACRARPYEKVRAQGLCRGHWFMVFRLTEASSSLWPPDRKVTPGTAGGTVRRRAVTVAMAISWLVYLCEQECPAVTMLGLSRCPPGRHGDRTGPCRQQPEPSQ